jgi:hypothetical protein
MKTWMKFLAVLAVVGMIGTAKAADDAAAKAGNPDKTAKDEKRAAKQAEKQAAKADKKPALRGEVVRVDGSTLTLKTGKKGAEKEASVTADANTVVMIEGKTAKLADLQPGAKVQIMGDAGKASKIVVPAAKVKKPKDENAAKGAAKGADKPVEKK